MGGLRIKFRAGPPQQQWRQASEIPLQRDTLQASHNKRVSSTLGNMQYIATLPHVRNKGREREHQHWQRDQSSQRRKQKQIGVQRSRACHGSFRICTRILTARSCEQLVAVVRTSWTGLNKVCGGHDGEIWRLSNPFASTTPPPRKQGELDKKDAPSSQCKGYKSPETTAYTPSLDGVSPRPIATSIFRSGRSSLLWEDQSQLLEKIKHLLHRKRPATRVTSVLC